MAESFGAAHREAVTAYHAKTETGRRISGEIVQLLGHAEAAASSGHLAADVIHPRPITPKELGRMLMTACNNLSPEERAAFAHAVVAGGS